MLNDVFTLYNILILIAKPSDELNEEQTPSSETEIANNYYILKRVTTVLDTVWTFHVLMPQKPRYHKKHVTILNHVILRQNSRKKLHPNAWVKNRIHLTSKDRKKIAHFRNVEYSSTSMRYRASWSTHHINNSICTVKHYVYLSGR